MSELIAQAREELVLSDNLTNELYDRGLINIDDQYGGQVFTIFNGDHNAKTENLYSKVEGIDFRNFTDSKGVRDILSKVGFIYDYDQEGNLSNVLYPEPSRLVNACRKNNIPIELSGVSTFKNTRIPEALYQSIILRGKHPVGTASLSSYMHDIKFDHIPAVIVLGDNLFDIFRSNLFLDEQVELADKYDTFTSEVSHAIRFITEGNQSEYNRIIEDYCPFIVFGHTPSKPKKEFSLWLKENVEQGLTRLGAS